MSMSDQPEFSTTQPQLAVSSGLIKLDGRAELAAAATALVSQARRTINICTPDLEPWLYAQSELVSAMQQFLLGQRGQLRIVLFDSELIRRGHGLVQLAQRLPTFVAIHRPLPEITQPDSAFMTVDAAGYLFRHHRDQPQGVVEYNDRFRVRELNDRFQQLWNQSEPEPECRRQGL